MLQTHSELHTHLMGMLSLEGILDILSKINYPGFPIDSDGNLLFDGNPNTPRTKKVTDKIKRGLIVPYGESIEYGDMEILYTNRSKLLADIANYYSNGNKDEEELLNEIYLIYLNHSLLELIDNKVTYVEISFSNKEKIAYMLKHLPRKITDKIDVKFLLCTNRIRSGKELEKDLEAIEETIAKDKAIGFDLMGKEEPFNNNENDSWKKKSNSINSFTRKLDLVIGVLHKYPKSTLRIHAGENIESKGNPLATLKMIDKVATQNNLVIPPPEIRLGHAIYFDDCKEYIDLLRKYKCIIEINASSNMALSNITDPNQLSYNYYLRNDIPVVISTDGAGIYDTDIAQENYIVQNVAGDYSYMKLLGIDEKIVQRKGTK